MSEPTLAGNWSDDDGQVIDTLLDENTDGQATAQPPTTAFVPATEKPKPTTVVLGTRTTLPAPNGTQVQWQQVLWPDPDRKAVHLHMNSLGGLSDNVRYSHDPGRLNSDMSCPSFTTTQPVDGMLHTGPLFLAAAVSAAVVDITAITS